MVMFHKQKVVLELESAILNLVANYRMYFQREKCRPRMHLFYTDLGSSDEPSMAIYNKFYRSYYRNHYAKNPDFKVIGELMTEIIVPEIELIMGYIPDCYFVRATRFDGSLIPAIVAQERPADHNVIITSDLFDTLYFFREKFSTVQIKRRYANFKVISTVEDSVQAIMPNESAFDVQIFTSEMYYKLLISVNGSKIRNIQSAKGFGFAKLLGVLQEGLDNNLILRDFGSISSVIELFPEKHRDDIKQAYECTDLETQLELLGRGDRDFVCSQLLDKADQASLEALNNKRFLEFPVNLSGLLG